jgi:hypothetical protein
VFETLFKYPRIVARHRAGPAVEARERFLKHSVGQGLAGATLLRHARELLVIAERIDITSGEPIGSSAVEAADCWAREQHDRHRVQSLQGRGNSLSKQPRPGCTSWDVWKKPNPRPLPTQTCLPRLCRLRERGARLIPGHYPRSGLAGGEVLELAGPAEPLFR